MKRIYAGLLIWAIFFCCGSVVAATKEHFRPRFSLVIQEGFGSIAIGDLNTTLSSLNDNPVYEAVRESNPERCVGEFAQVPDGFKDWEAELRWNLWRSFSLGVSVSGPIHMRQKSSLTYTIVEYAGTQTEIDTFDSEIRVSAPVRFSLYYARRILPAVELEVGAGLGLYQARMIQNQQWQFRFPMDDTALGYYLYDVSGTKTGFHCGFALEYELNDRFSVIAGGQWKFAKIDALKGHLVTGNDAFDAEGNLVGSEMDTAEGTLYHYLQSNLRLGVRCERMSIHESWPEIGLGAPSEIRQAFLDLSGFTFRIGLKIGLF